MHIAFCTIAFVGIIRAPNVLYVISERLLKKVNTTGKLITNVVKTAYKYI